MANLKRASSDDLDFIYLVGLLDKDLWTRYPLTQQNYTANNTIKPNTNAVIAYEDGEPVGCGCFRETGIGGAVEIKRMYVVEPMRGKGIAKSMLRELECWAAGLGWNEAVLETGINQPEAILLYTRAGYARINNYGPYAGNKESICMCKNIGKS